MKCSCGRSLRKSTCAGQVRFAGKYTIQPGETLKSVLERAGGLTKYAFADGAVYTRKELREPRAEAARHARGENAERYYLCGPGGWLRPTSHRRERRWQVGQSLLTQLKATKAVGRLVINLPATNGASPWAQPVTFILRDGDELLIPKFEQEVTVIGECTERHLASV